MLIVLVRQNKVLGKKNSLQVLPPLFKNTSQKNLRYMNVYVNVG